MALSENSPQQKRTGQLAKVMVAAAALLGFVGFLYLRSREPLADQAADILKAAHRSSGRELIDAASADEVRMSHLTEDNLSQVLKLIVNRGISGWEPVGIETTLSKPPTVWAQAKMRLRSSSGQQTSLNITLRKSGDKGSGAILKQVLTDAWTREAAVRTRGKYSNREATLEGVRRDRATLEGLGIPGMYMGPNEGFASWSDLEANLARPITGQSK